MEWVDGDLHDRAALASFIRGTDVCIHLAAQVQHAPHEVYRRVNSEGTENVCQAVLEHSPNTRLIYCSSIAALQVRPRFRFLSTRYALSKYEAGLRVAEYQARGLRAAVVYAGMIYGPGDRQFIPGVLKHLANNRFFLVSGGERQAPLVYVDDLCDLFLTVARHPAAEGKCFVGVGPREVGMHTFFRRLAEKKGLRTSFPKIPKGLIFPVACFNEAMHERLKRSHPPALSKRSVDVLSLSYRHSLLDNTGIGWEPKIGMEEGLEKTLRELDAG